LSEKFRPHHSFWSPRGWTLPEFLLQRDQHFAAGELQGAGRWLLIPVLEGAKKFSGLRVARSEYDMVFAEGDRSDAGDECSQGCSLAGRSTHERVTGGRGQGQWLGSTPPFAAVAGFADFVVRGGDEASIGVLVEDLVTKPPIEPYRRFTFLKSTCRINRLQPLIDNAYERLTSLVREIGWSDDDPLDAVFIAASAIHSSRPTSLLSADLPRRFSPTDWFATARQPTGAR